MRCVLPQSSSATHRYSSRAHREKRISWNDTPKKSSIIWREIRVLCFTFQSFFGWNVWERDVEIVSNSHKNAKSCDCRTSTDFFRQIKRLLELKVSLRHTDVQWKIDKLRRMYFASVSATLFLRLDGNAYRYHDPRLCNNFYNSHTRTNPLSPLIFFQKLDQSEKVEISMTW